MLQIVFNELSLQEQAQSEGHAVAMYQQLFRVIDKVTALKIDRVRLRMAINIIDKSISAQFFSLRNWLKGLSHGDRQRYLGYIAQEPIITDNPYFSYGNQNVVGLGYAFLNDLLAVSYPTNNVWTADVYQIKKDYLPDADSPVEEEMVDVRHGQIIVKADATEELNHKDWVRETYNQRQGLQAESIQSIADLWARKNEIFPYLEFAEEVEVQLHTYSSVKDSHLTKAFHYLQSLNQHLSRAAAGEVVFADIPGDYSNESQATLQEFHVERTFTYPPGESKLFSLHVKLGGLRIYLMPLANEGKCVVGYIGKHLPTKNFAK